MRRYCATETYNSKERTHRSHPIAPITQMTRDLYVQTLGIYLKLSYPHGNKTYMYIKIHTPKYLYWHIKGSTYMKNRLHT